MTEMKYHWSDFEAKLTNDTHQNPKVMETREAECHFEGDDLQRRKGVVSQVNQFYLYMREVGVFFKHIKLATENGF